MFNIYIFVSTAVLIFLGITLQSNNWVTTILRFIVIINACFGLYIIYTHRLLG